MYNYKFKKLLDNPDHLWFNSISPRQFVTSKGFKDPVDYGQHMLQLLNKYLAGERTHIIHNELFTTTLVGGDPEFFISNNERIVPSYEWLNTPPESHDNFCFFNESHTPNNAIFNPEKFNWLTSPNTNEGGYSDSWIHPDGVQLEMGYIPSTCMEITSRTIYNLIDRTRRALHKNKLMLSPATSSMITEATAHEVPLGCRPSFNAHDIDNTINNKSPLRRFTGGHFHFSVLAQPLQREIYVGKEACIFDPMDLEIFNTIYALKNIDDDNRRQIYNPVIKAMDATMGILSVAMAGELDDPERRHHHYGMAGDYRLTTNTIEYRVPSNVMWSNPITWHIMGMMGRYIVNNSRLPKSTLPDFVASVNTWGDITDIINNTDYVAARKYFQTHKDEIFKLFAGIPAISDNKGKISRLAEEGVSAHFEGIRWSLCGEYPTTLGKWVM